MRITICGSMHFAQTMLDTQKKLQKLEHEVIVPILTKECVTNPELNIDVKSLVENDCMRDHFNKIAAGDAILVINEKRKGVDGYIGGSTLMEIGIAYFNKKKIFILNQLPSEAIFSYIFEVKLTNSIILNGDLTKIK